MEVVRLVIADGGVCHLQMRDNDDANCNFEFTGADCDPIYDFALTERRHLFTACRDRVVRKYSLSGLMGD